MPQYKDPYSDSAENISLLTSVQSYRDGKHKFPRGSRTLSRGIPLSMCSSYWELWRIHAHPQLCHPDRLTTLSVGTFWVVTGIMGQMDLWDPVLKAGPSLWNNVMWHLVLMGHSAGPQTAALVESLQAGKGNILRISIKFSQNESQTLPRHKDWLHSLKEGYSLLLLGWTFISSAARSTVTSISPLLGPCTVINSNLSTTLCRPKGIPNYY